MERGAATFESCAVCGRTILKGERASEYVTVQGQHVGVCALCRSRAEAEGWIPAEQYRNAGRVPAGRPRRGQALRKRLGQAASRARTVRERASAKPRAREGADAGRDARERAAPERGRRTASERGRRAAAPKPAQPEKPPEQPARPKRRVIRSPDAVIRRAVERFNRSGERRKIAGLIRSLGEPRAAVLPDPRNHTALVTVAWELSWYQWEVGIDGESEPVREVAKGKEVSELSQEARAWNAAVEENGRLRVELADRAESGGSAAKPSGNGG